ncbi:TonB family protein [Lysobacter sp. TY2-98]|uniref:energy transducer TonB n=1 Tax=Lysobacter sp. TY2-98 TaxID=2290922 RepID=UPI000E202110|nr:TonB family protein [Lysobacter sp. TY2-98]AXK71685.1 TonB family protein [Lysobacter sp. TY2-98]
MAPSPTPSGERPGRRPFRFDRRLALWITLAFAAGLILFALAIRKSDGTFYRAGEVPPSTAEPGYAPLPAPMAGDDGSGIGTLTPPPPIAAPETPATRAAPVSTPASTPAPEPRPASVADRKARPLPGQTPPPDYPMRALRDGDTGTVLVLVHIGPDGVPTATEVAQSSGSRELDRAALQGVRRWRFEPAIADGHPTVGDVVVPIDFKLSE